MLYRPERKAIIGKSKKKNYPIFFKSENRSTSSSISVKENIIKCGLSLIEHVIFDIQFVRVIKSYIHAPLSRKLLEKSSIHLITKKIKEKENSRNILHVIFLVGQSPSIDSWAGRFCTKWPPTTSDYVRVSKHS